MIGKVFLVTTSAFTKAKLKGFEFNSSNMNGTKILVFTESLTQITVTRYLGQKGGVFQSSFKIDLMHIPRNMRPIVIKNFIRSLVTILPTVKCNV